MIKTTLNPNLESIRSKHRKNKSSASIERKISLTGNISSSRMH
jgi:hypothetical protein